MIAKSLMTALVAVAPIEVANACSIISPPIEETVEEIASKGVLIRGKLIQPFDLSKEAPEIIDADEIYIGDGGPKPYLIYRPKSEYERVRKFREQHRRGEPPPICGPFFDHKVEVGKEFDRLVLMPAPVGSDPAAVGRWVFHFWNGNVSRERGLDLLLKAADQHGRLRSRPRRDGAENCQECLPAEH